MSKHDDPNADIIGYTFIDTHGRKHRVLKTETWSSMYVQLSVEGIDGEFVESTARPASVIRRHKQLAE